MSEEDNSMNSFESDDKNNPVNELDNEEENNSTNTFENQEDAEFYASMNQTAEVYDIFETVKC